jgi:hypothetical protein
MLRFKVFGMLVGVERAPAGRATGQANGWDTYWLGNEGKRRPADFVVPDFVTEDELPEYLRDLFHESATPQHPDVVRLP